MKLTAPQKIISSDPNRFRVVSAGRRFGKSFLAINELAKYARLPKQKILYVGPTYRQVKTVIWDELKEQLGKRRWIRKVNESDLKITLVNGSTIILRSTENYDSLRGTKFNFAVLDEVQDIKPDAWTQVIRPTLSDLLGHALMIGTPRGQGNWFYELWSQAKTREDWNSFQYTTLEGGNVLPSEVEAARRDLDERTFEQEYCAKFVNYSGQIFYSYSAENVVEFDQSKFTDRTAIHIGMDFNVSPLVAIVGIKSATQLHIIDEIEIYGSNTNEMVQEIRNRYGAFRQVYVYPDATGSRQNTNSNGVSDHIILQNAGFKIISGKVNPVVLDSIASVNSLLLNGSNQRNLLIDPRCQKLIKNIIGYSYKEGTRIPDKSSGYDHMADALRYIVHKLFPLQQLPMVANFGMGANRYRTI